MKLLIAVFLFLFFVLVKSGLGDETEALRNSLKTLCSYNTEGAFNDCCLASQNGASVTLENTGCFLSSIHVDNFDFITELFALFFPPPFSHYFSLFFYFPQIFS